MNSRIIKIVLIMLLAMSLIMASVCISNADAAADWYNETSVSYDVQVSAPDGYVNVRSGPGVDYDILTSATNGVIMHVVAEANASNGKTWGQVNYNGYYGWIALSQVTTDISQDNETSSDGAENNTPSKSQGYDQNTSDPADGSEYEAADSEIEDEPMLISADEPVVVQDSGNNIIVILLLVIIAVLIAIIVLILLSRRRR